MKRGQPVVSEQFLPVGDPKNGAAAGAVPVLDDPWVTEFAIGRGDGFLREQRNRTGYGVLTCAEKEKLRDLRS